MQRTKHPPERRAEALRLLAEVGLAEASRRCGIAPGTIASWGHRNGVHAPSVANMEAIHERKQIAWAERKLVLGQKLGELASKAALRIEQRLDADRDVRSARDLAATMAVLVDKAQLLTGGVTSRAEVVERTIEHESEVAKVLQLARSA